MIALRTDDILSFWFGTSDNPLQNQHLWWTKDPNFDDRVANQFKNHINSIAPKPFDVSHCTAQDCLAYVILFDQFPRNVFRGHPQSFDYDHLALAATLDGITHKIDTQLTHTERQFFYLPLEHAENLDMQHLSVEKFENLKESTPTDILPNMNQAYDYAIAHLEVIQRYGRFPHRNKILGRKNTPEEQHYLADPSSGF